MGNCPGSNEGAVRRESGKIRKVNARVRRLLCEFPQAAVRTRCALKAKFESLAIRTAHKMRLPIHAMLGNCAQYLTKSVDCEALSVTKNSSRGIKMLCNPGFMPKPVAAVRHL